MAKQRPTVEDLLNALGGKQYLDVGRRLMHPEDYQQGSNTVMPADQPTRGYRGSQERNPRVYRSVSDRLRSGNF